MKFSNQKKRKNPINKILSFVTSPGFCKAPWESMTISLDDIGGKKGIIHCHRTALEEENIFDVKVHRCKGDFCSHRICKKHNLMPRTGDNAPFLRNIKGKTKLSNPIRNSQKKSKTTNKKFNNSKTSQINLEIIKPEATTIFRSTGNNSFFQELSNNSKKESSKENKSAKEKTSCALYFYGQDGKRKLSFQLQPELEMFLFRAIDRIGNCSTNASKVNLKTRVKYEKAQTEINSKRQKIPVDISESSGLVVEERFHKGKSNQKETTSKGTQVEEHQQEGSSQMKYSKELKKSQGSTENLLEEMSSQIKKRHLQRHNLEQETTPNFGKYSKSESSSKGEPYRDRWESTSTSKLKPEKSRSESPIKVCYPNSCKCMENPINGDNGRQDTTKKATVRFENDKMTGSLQDIANHTFSKPCRCIEYDQTGENFTKGVSSLNHESQKKYIKINKTRPHRTVFRKSYVDDPTICTDISGNNMINQVWANERQNDFTYCRTCQCSKEQSFSQEPSLMNANKYIHNHTSQGRSHNIYRIESEFDRSSELERPNPEFQRGQIYSKMRNGKGHHIIVTNTNNEKNHECPSMNQDKLGIDSSTYEKKEVDRRVVNENLLVKNEGPYSYYTKDLRNDNLNEDVNNKYISRGQHGKFNHYQNNSGFNRRSVPKYSLDRCNSVGKENSGALQTTYDKCKSFEDEFKKQLNRGNTSHVESSSTSLMINRSEALLRADNSTESHKYIEYDRYRECLPPREYVGFPSQSVNFARCIADTATCNSPKLLGHSDRFNSHVVCGSDFHTFCSSPQCNVHTDRNSRGKEKIDETGLSSSCTPLIAEKKQPEHVRGDENYKRLDVTPTIERTVFPQLTNSTSDRHDPDIFTYIKCESKPPELFNIAKQIIYSSSNEDISKKDCPSKKLNFKDSPKYSKSFITTDNQPKTLGFKTSLCPGNVCYSPQIFQTNETTSNPQCDPMGNGVYTRFSNEETFVGFITCHTSSPFVSSNQSYRVSEHKEPLKKNAFTLSSPVSTSYVQTLLKSEIASAENNNAWYTGNKIDCVGDGRSHQHIEDCGRIVSLSTNDEPFMSKARFTELRNIHMGSLKDTKTFNLSAPEDAGQSEQVKLPPDPNSNRNREGCVPRPLSLIKRRKSHFRYKRTRTKRKEVRCCQQIIYSKEYRTQTKVCVPRGFIIKSVISDHNDGIRAGEKYKIVDKNYVDSKKNKFNTEAQFVTEFKIKQLNRKDSSYKSLVTQLHLHLVRTDKLYFCNKSKSSNKLTFQDPTVDPKFGFRPNVL